MQTVKAQYQTGGDVVLQICTSVNDVKVEIAQLQKKPRLGTDVIVLDATTNKELEDDNQKPPENVIIKLVDSHYPKAYHKALLVHALSRHNEGVEPVLKHMNKSRKANPRKLTGQVLVHCLANMPTSLPIGRVVERLVLAKADLIMSDNEQNTALRHAVIRNMPSVVRLLLNNRARVDEKPKDHETPLTVAVTKGFVGVIGCLLVAKASVNGRDATNLTPLHLAVRGGAVDVVSCLINAKAQANDQTGTVENPMGRDTPLHMAVILSDGGAGIISLLLAANGSLNIKNAAGNLPFHLAAERTRLDVVSLLLTAKASVNTGTDIDMPLHMASRSADPDVLNAIIQAKADVNKKNKLNNTPLHAASSRNFPDGIKVLLECKALINCANGDGNTPLHLAVQNKLRRNIIVLLDTNAKKNIKNKEGLRPAEMTTSAETLELLGEKPPPEVSSNSAPTPKRAGGKGNSHSSKGSKGSGKGSKSDGGKGGNLKKKTKGRKLPRTF